MWWPSLWAVAITAVSAIFARYLPVTRLERSTMSPLSGKEAAAVYGGRDVVIGGTLAAYNHQFFPPCWMAGVQLQFPFCAVVGLAVCLGSDQLAVVRGAAAFYEQPPAPSVCRWARNEPYPVSRARVKTLTCSCPPAAIRGDCTLRPPPL